jgi:hypothetical protein
LRGATPAGSMIGERFSLNASVDAGQNAECPDFSAGHRAYVPLLRVNQTTQRYERISGTGYSYTRHPGVMAGVHPNCGKLRWLPAPDQVRGRLCAGMTMVLRQQPANFFPDRRKRQRDLTRAVTARNIQMFAPAPRLARNHRRSTPRRSIEMFGISCAFHFDR